MKRFLQLSLMVMLLALPIKALAVSFSATNEQGKEIKYQVVSVNPNIVKVVSGGDYTGTLIIPGYVSDGSTTYKVKGIANFAFSSSSLEYVELPETVDFIENLAFYQCYNLTSIKILGTITGCERESFYFNADKLYNIEGPQASADGKCLVIDGALRLFARAGITDYVLPESVRSIDGNFENFSTLKSITLPSELTYIGPRSFYGCRLLESISIPDKVTTIGSEAFSGCSSMLSLSLGSSLKTIDNEAFYQCYKLASVSLPASLESLGENAFSHCEQLRDVTFANGLKTIGKRAFTQSGITEALLPASLKKIGNETFWNCKALTTVTMPSTLNDMGTEVFHNCTSLTSVTLPDALVEIPSDIFSGCTALQSVTLGSNTKKIGERSFENCTALASIDLPASITVISSSAFNGSGLEAVTLPASLTDLGDYAFKDCSFLTAVTFNSKLTKIGQEAFRKTNVEEIVLPDNLSTIGTRAFHECASLKSVKFGANTTYTGSYTFAECVNLEKAELGPKIYYIDAEAFRNCRMLSDLKMSNVLMQIGDGAFWGCENLPEIVIPNTTMSIGKNAFRGCIAATKLTLGTKLNTIDDFAFNTCPQIPEVVLPKSVCTLGNGVFAWCSSLQKVTLSDNLTWVGWGIFAGCNRLETFTGKFATADHRNFVFRTELKGVAPYGLTQYTTPKSITYNGTTYKVETIERGCFHGINQIEEVTIAEPVKYIGYDAFLESGIHSVTLGNSVEDIRTGAFQDCADLNTVVFGEGVKHIFQEAFSGCRSLNDMYLLPANPPTGGRSYYTDSDDVYHQSYYDYLYGDVFKDVDKSACTLHVRKPSKNLYLAAQVWRDFENYVIIKEDNRLEAGTLKAKPSGVTELNVEMYNSDAISAFQCDIVLPEGASVRMIDGVPDVQLSPRSTSAHSLSLSMVDARTLRVVCHSSASSAFTGNDGLLFTVSLKAPSAEGNYTVKIANIHLTTPDGRQFTPEDAEVALDVEAGLRGDANYDGEVNVTDLVYITNYILGYNPAGFSFGNADVNEDGEINVTDIVETINIILHPDNCASTMAKITDASESDDSYATTIFADDFDVIPEKTKEVCVSLTNPDYRLTALQFTMSLPEGLRIVADDNGSNFAPTTRLTDSHIIDSSCHNEAYTVVSYSSCNSDFEGSDGAIIIMTLEADETFKGGDICFSNIVTTEADGTQHKLSDTTAHVTLDPSSLELPVNENGEAEYFDLNGVPHSMPLAPGFYIRRTQGTASKILIK